LLKRYNGNLIHCLIIRISEGGTIVNNFKSLKK
jgi:hypothetical protein